MHPPYLNLTLFIQLHKQDDGESGSNIDYTQYIQHRKPVG